MNRNRRNTKLGRPIASDATTMARDAALARWKGPALVFGRWDAERPAGVHTRLVWDKGPSAGMGNLSIPWGRSDGKKSTSSENGYTGRRKARWCVFKCSCQLTVNGPITQRRNLFP